MLNYVNSISCSVNDNRNEFVLAFRQLYPVLAADGTIKESGEVLVSELVMGRELVDALRRILDGALSSDSIAD